MIIRQKISVRQKHATGFVYLKGSLYHDAEVSSHLRYCLHDETINAAPKIGVGG